MSTFSRVIEVWRRRVVVTLLAASAIVFPAVVAHADCPGYPECARDHCDDLCCFGYGGTCDLSSSDGNEFCTAGGSGTCILDTYCWPPCLAAKDDSGVKTDGGYDVVIPDSGYEVSVGDTGPGFDAGPPPDTNDDLPTAIDDDQICYVFVHGSEPLGKGPSAKSAPAATYWGTGRANDPSGAADNVGEFIQSFLAGQDVKRDGGPQPLPDPPEKRWAAVTYDGTWPFYWASLDVLQQLESIENGDVPVSLEFVTGDDDQLAYHHGVNHCKKGDFLVTIGHSMGNLVVAFLLENFHPDDLNYEFLRTGGLSADAPFFDPVHRDWISSSTESSADAYNKLKPATDTPLPWNRPARIDPATKKELPASPDSAREECFYPPIGDTTPRHFPFVDATDGRKGIGRCLGPKPSVTDIVSKIAYHYSVAGPFRGSFGADCICENGYPSDAPTLCRKARSLMDSWAVAPILARTAFTTCNPAAVSLQSGAAYLVENMGSDLGRHVYLIAGTDPSYVTTLPIVGTKIAMNPLDCVANGDPDECQITKLWPGGAFNSSPDGYPQPMNDTAVPISSAMACDVDIWSSFAKMSLSTSGSAAFARGMCGENEKVWPGWASNDVVFAIAHTELRQGKIRREAYATPDSFWSHVVDPVTDRDYEPGAPLIFGYVGSTPAPSCFDRPPPTDFNASICKKSSESSYFDRRQKYEGCGAQCKSAGFGVNIVREHRSIGHVLAIEERYVERRAREF